MKKNKKTKEPLTKKELLRFRKPMEAIYIYSYDSYEWWGCPRCKSVIERDGQRYCGCCGQHISWKNFYK